MDEFPRTGRAFAHTRLVGPRETGVDGRARLDAIVDWLQVVAFADVIDAGLQDAVLWVVRRVTLAIERFPRLGETIEVRRRAARSLRAGPSGGRASPASRRSRCGWRSTR